MTYPTLYSAATWASTPAINALLNRRQRLGKEDPFRLAERRGFASLDRPKGDLFWFHAASVGETIAIVPLADQLRQWNQNANVLVTSGTVSSARLMQTVLPERCFHQYVPLDHPTWVKRFLHHWQPNAAVWVESELWPNLIRQTNQLGIPMGLLNARISEKSASRWTKYAKGFAQDLLGRFDLILAQDETNSDRFARHGLVQAHGAANLKRLFGFARALTAEDHARFQAIESFEHRWVAASTHPGEERLALEASAKLGREYPDHLTVLAPRHPERVPDIEELARAFGRKPTRYSAYKPGDPLDVLIVDSIGLLSKLYEALPIAFIGGSMNLGLGGHNVFEALRGQTAVLFGPDMANFYEVSQRLLDLNAAMPVETSSDLASHIDQLLARPDRATGMTQRASQLVAQDHKQRQFVLDAVHQLLAP